MYLTSTPGFVPSFHPELGLRDLGGWTAADGRVVRHGFLYRGSALTGLTDDELHRIDELGLRFILDLRAAGEVEGREDYVPAGAEYQRIGGMYDQDGMEVDFSPAGISRIMGYIMADPEHFLDGLYASMMFENPAVHALVDRFVEGPVPLYFHCTAGKDRTGVCAAILLALLGVPDDAIFTEYLLTNEYRASIINMTPEEMPKGISDLDRENWAKINSVDATQLKAAFDAIDERYETREAYFKDEFGLDATALEALRDRYLEVSAPTAPILNSVTTLLDTPYIKVYDLAYQDGLHYYDASRRGEAELLATHHKDELQHALPDAVSCCLVLAPPAAEPRLVLFLEYRYPTGQYMLSIPSGLIDDKDRTADEPLITAMTREIFEETGIELQAEDEITVLNPLLFNSPGFTDESTALLRIVVKSTDASHLSHGGAEGSERFGNFILATKEDVRRMLKEGRDPYGNYYPMVTWAAMTHFANL